MRTIIAASFLASACFFACSGSINSSEPDAAVEPDGGAKATGNDGSAGSDAGTKTTTSTTTSGDASAAETSTTKNDPSCSAQPNEGDACTVEGAFCNPTPCTDECQFCNVMHCENGEWTRMEAFPMPQSYCATVQCGSTTCGKAQYCIKSLSGPAPADGGTGITYSCGALPSGCTGCACAETATTAAKSCYSVSCTADPQTGKPMVTCANQ